MKKITLITSILLLTLSVTSCKSNLSSSERVERDAALKEQLAKAERGDYQIVMNAAFPLNTVALNNTLNAVLLPNGDNANRIDLTDRNDFMELDNDEVITADLSFFGERRIAGGYGNQDNGIDYKGIPKDYRSSIDYKKGKVDIDYQISNQTESFDVSIELFANGNANVNISSSHRSMIRYTGMMEQIKEMAL